MAGIFPPQNDGGKPPTASTCNGFLPEHQVLGEGPLYFAPNCTTTLRDCTMNAIISEMLAFVDSLGYPWNANRVDNIAEAVDDVLTKIRAAIELRVLRAGDTMDGPLILSRDPQQPLEAATRRWVLDQDTNLDQALRDYIGTVAATITAAYQAMINAVDERKINRSGDTMTGPLILARNPQEQMEAATRAFVENLVGAAVGGGISDAPEDGVVYARYMGQWVPVSLDDGEYDGVGGATAPARRGPRPRRDDGEY